MLVSSKEMLCKAREEGYAVGSFNIFNLESAKAIIAAAEAENAPVMLQIWSGFADFIGLDVLGAIAVCEAKRARVPVAVHLDHGATLSQVGQSVAAGFTSVMLDGSALPLEENIALTRNVVEFCRGLGIPVEGEIGHVGGSEDARLSIGTFHGVYEDAPRLNIDLLKALAARISAPLVLHGSSYTPDDQLAEAVRHGISKINVATEVSDTMIRATLEHTRSLEKVKYANQLTDAPYQAVTELVRHKIRLFGGSGKA